jgi:hypothetical protein
MAYEDNMQMTKTRNGKTMIKLKNIIFFWIKSFMFLVTINCFQNINMFVDRLFAFKGFIFCFASYQTALYQIVSLTLGKLQRTK